MKWFLKLKHWQLFLLIVGLQFFTILYIVYRDFHAPFSPFPGQLYQPYTVVCLFPIAILGCWFYAVATRLYEKIPDELKRSLTRFKVFLIFAGTYIVLGWSLMVFNAIQAHMWLIALILPMHIFAMFCILYVFYYIARSLRTVELGRRVELSDYLGDFVLIWIFPIGIWIIQPKINKIFAE